MNIVWCEDVVIPQGWTRIKMGEKIKKQDKYFNYVLQEFEDIKENEFVYTAPVVLQHNWVVIRKGKTKNHPRTDIFLK